MKHTLLFFMFHRYTALYILENTCLFYFQQIVFNNLYKFMIIYNF